MKSLSGRNSGWSIHLISRRSSSVEKWPKQRVDYLALPPGLVMMILLFLPCLGIAAQDWLQMGTGLGSDKPRIAVPDFVGRDGASEPWAELFSNVVRSDLYDSGILELVSKNVYPAEVPALPGLLKGAEWSSPPVAVQFLAFGNITVGQRNFSVEAWLYDVQNRGESPIFARVYAATASDAQMRAFAHQFADEVISRISGGVGIASSQIAFVSSRGGNKEIWIMDYDGINQRPLTSLGSTVQSPQWSPDSNSIAFTCQPTSRVEVSHICIYSTIAKQVSFWPLFLGPDSAPTWSPDGRKIMFTSSVQRYTRLFTADTEGGQLRRVPHSRGSASAAWNRKNGQQVAFVSNRDGTFSLYTISPEGRNMQKVPLLGIHDVMGPAWSPNGQLLAFSAQGRNDNRDLYVMDLVSRQFLRLTNAAGRNERPSWAPDGRHIVFESTRTGMHQLWSIMADGSNTRQLTSEGQNEDPSWSPGVAQ